VLAHTTGRKVLIPPPPPTPPLPFLAFRLSDIFIPAFRLANQANTTVKTDMKHATLGITPRFSSPGAGRDVLGLGCLNTPPTESGFE
jgi:hypothetical protein